jgi:hypothetical protein
MGLLLETAPCACVQRQGDMQNLVNRVLSGREMFM